MTLVVFCVCMRSVRGLLMGFCIGAWVAWVCVCVCAGGVVDGQWDWMMGVRVVRTNGTSGGGD